MKILFYTQLWKRPELTELVFRQITSLKREGYEFIHFAVLSEESMIPLCEKYGIKYVWSENKPLGRKHNIGLDAAMKLEWDYMINYGSDDLVSEKILDLFEPYLKKGVDFFGLNDIYFYDGYHKVLTSYSYNKVGQAVFGAGRVTSRKMLDKIKGGAGRIKFWDDHLNRGLDKSSRDIARIKGYDNISIRTKEPVIIDVKTDTNIWGPKNYQGTEKDTQCLEGYFSKEIVEAMENIEVLNPIPNKMEEQVNMKIYEHRKNAYARYKKKLYNPDGTPRMVGPVGNQVQDFEYVEFKGGYDGGSPDHSGPRQVVPGRLATNNAELQHWIEVKSGLFGKDIFLRNEIIPKEEKPKPAPVPTDPKKAKIEALSAKVEAGEEITPDEPEEEEVVQVPVDQQEEETPQFDEDPTVVEVSSVSQAKVWMRENASKHGFEITSGDIRNRDAIKEIASKHNIEFKGI